MMRKYELHEYQLDAIEFVKKKKKCALFLDMGLGKTVISLTAASHLLDDFFIKKVLIISPLRVANAVWQQESKKWTHLKELKIKVCTGTEKERLLSLSSNVDIHIINRENVQWLVENQKWKWDMIIIDESSSFKNIKSKRFKALKKVIKFVKSTVLLTGTPSPNGLMDLWSQIFLIDNGERLGRTMGIYRQRFFNPAGYMGYGWKPKKNAEDKIKSLIKDICIRMDAKDYLELPDRITVNEYVSFPENIKKQYDELEKEFLISLDNETDIEALSSAALANKLLQMCNGAIYDADKKTHEIHHEKIQTLKEIIADNPSENFFVAYNFNSDLKRLIKAFPEAKVLSRSAKELEKWNEGKIKILFAHPASAGHGLNAHSGGSVIVWFGLNWSLELYQQFNARLHRQGQTKPVRIIHIVAKGGIDEKVLMALNDKAKTQNDLLEYFRSHLLIKNPTDSSPDNGYSH